MAVEASVADPMSVWKKATNRLLAGLEAQSAAPAADGPALEGDADPYAEAGDQLLGAATEAWVALAPRLDDRDVAAQATALLSANMALATQILAATDDAAADGPVEVSLDLGQILALADLVADPYSGLPAADGGTPKAVGDVLNALQKAAGDELVAVATSATALAAGEAMVSGLGHILEGAAKIAFESVVRSITGFWKWAKRLATRIVDWVTNTIIAHLPGPFRNKAKDLKDTLVEKIRAGDLTGAFWAQVLGRPDAEKRWQQADGHPGYDAALAAVGESTTLQLARLGWVTKGREAIDSWLVKAGIGTLLAQAHPGVQVAAGGAVVAVLLWVLYQLEDGIDAVTDLAPIAAGPGRASSTP